MCDDEKIFYREMAELNIDNIAFRIISTIQINQIKINCKFNLVDYYISIKNDKMSYLIFFFWEIWLKIICLKITYPNKKKNTHFHTNMDRGSSFVCRL